MKIGGPYYIAPMHKKEVVDAILAKVQVKLDRLESGPAPTPNTLLPTASLSAADAEQIPISTIHRLHGLLTAVSEELFDVPFFYHLPDLCAQVKCRPMSLPVFHSALINGGYRVSATHKEPMAIKTDAPENVVWDIIRCWCLEHRPEGNGKKKLEMNSNRIDILSRPPEFIADFTVVPSKAERTKALRHPPNPEQHWGPKKRAGRGPSDSLEEPEGKKSRKALTGPEKEARAAARREKKRLCSADETKQDNLKDEKDPGQDSVLDKPAGGHDL